MFMVPGLPEISVSMLTIDKAWTIADTTMAGRLPLPENYPAGKTRIAFYVTSNGHFATVSMASSIPKSVYDTLILSLMDPVEKTLTQLNAFQPHRLTGYSSSVAQLAELALEGRLDDLSTANICWWG